jgi:hypothetical protein
VLRDDAANKCVHGVCTLLEPVVGAGNPDDLGGVDECLIRKQSDIRYDPPAEGGLFRKGARVQATVDCTTDDSSTDGTSGTNGSDTSGGAASSSADQSGDAPPS